MDQGINRREFFNTSAAGTICMSSIMRPVSVGAVEAAPRNRNGMTKTRIGKVYLGRSSPGWPTPTLNLEEDKQRIEAEFAKLGDAFRDIEFVDGGIVSINREIEPVLEKFKDVDGILAIHLSLGVGPLLIELLKLGIPITLFSQPYSGHEWHIIAPLQKQGKKIDVFPTSEFSDLATAIRPFRAIHRMKEAKILYMDAREADPEYVKIIKDKFGTEIKTTPYQLLPDAYHSVDQEQVMIEAKRWMDEAEKIVEPTKEEIINSARMYLALVKMLEEEKADLITISCLGLGLMQQGLAYPCLGFSRLNGMGLGGVCEADLKSSMTHLIFQYLTGKPGFVSDPVVDLSNSTIIHAHCVSAIKMDGPDGEQCPYIIRSHLEDNLGASLQVKMRIGQPISMARLIGSDIMLFSTGKIIDNPDSERGCRTKITTKVEHVEKILENYSCGLHRVIFYGDHTRDIKRFCRFMDISVLHEGEENLFDVPGLEWETYIHA
ncbi:MAG: hypothetical protein C4527_07015 [Candidatus Omnitrophota bacterium]|jgi:hypothetical protein|nr:MAG: hypothetical protein C4527_07015 [Candidatus Omnitrophota bacterium]